MIMMIITLHLTTIDYLIKFRADDLSLPETQLARSLDWRNLIVVPGAWQMMMMIMMSRSAGGSAWRKAER